MKTEGKNPHVTIVNWQCEKLLSLKENLLDKTWVAAAAAFPIASSMNFYRHFSNKQFFIGDEVNGLHYFILVKW